MLAVPVFAAIQISALEQNREKDILANQPAAFANAMVIKIIPRQSKSGTHYYAQLKYTANGQTIVTETLSDGRLQVGQMLLVKYSVRYPEMFAIYIAK